MANTRRRHTLCRSLPGHLLIEELRHRWVAMGNLYGLVFSYGRADVFTGMSPHNIMKSHSMAGKVVADLKEVE